MKNLSFIENDAFQEWNRLIRDYKKAESQLKRVTLEKQILIQQYIKPFFHLLGWSENKKNRLHLERIDPLSNPGKPNPPDFLLINRHKPLFFIDVKKPVFPIKEQKERAYQLRRYSFSANLPIAVSTDFEEFALFDCRIKPELTDNLETARLFYSDIDSLFSPCEIIPGVRNIDFLFSVFSSSALMGNQFRQFLEEMPTPSYTTNVRSELSKATESWHFILLQELSAMNPSLSKQDLSLFTSHFILTLLYWRYLEDTKQEKYATLYQLALSEDPWNSMKLLWEKKKQFWKSDQPFFSTIRIGRETLYSILQQLYYPDSPFEFSVIPPSTYLRTFSALLSRKSRGSAKRTEYSLKEKNEGKTMFSSIIELLIQSKILTPSRKRLFPWIPIWHLENTWVNLLSSILKKTNTKWRLDYSICPSLSPDLVWIQSWFPPLVETHGIPQKEGFLYIPYEDIQQNKEIMQCLETAIQPKLPYLRKVALLIDLRWTAQKQFQQLWQFWTGLIFPKTMHLFQMNKQGFLLVFLSLERRPKQILFTKYTVNEHYQITQTLMQPISLDSAWKTKSAV